MITSPVTLSQICNILKLFATPHLFPVPVEDQHLHLHFVDGTIVYDGLIYLSAQTGF